MSQNKDVDKDLPWLNATVEHAEAELSVAGKTFSKISLTAPMNIWKTKDTRQQAFFPAPYRAPGEPRKYGLWGPPGTADVQPPPESSSTAEPTTKGGAESKKKKTDWTEEVGWMKSASDEDWAAYLNQQDIKEPDPQYKVEYWKSNKEKWTFVGQDNVVDVLFSPLRKSQRVVLVDDEKQQRTYHVYWHQQLQGVQLNLYHNTWRQIRALPIP